MCALLLRGALRWHIKITIMCGNPFAIYLNTVQLLMVLINQFPGSFFLEVFCFQIRGFTQITQVKSISKILIINQYE